MNILNMFPNQNVPRHSNGRVDILGPSVEAQFAMYDKIPAHQCTTYRDALVGNWTSTPLSDAYFCDQNISRLQEGISRGVSEMSKGNYLVGPQNCDTLKIIMRSVFLTHSANLRSDIRGQVNALNKIVLDYAVPQVYGSVQGYMNYRRDASTLSVPLALPQQTGNKTKTLEFKGFF
jgi:hypothetical protein